MSLTVVHISRELDVSAVKVAKGFVSMHHQRPNVISPKWWASLNVGLREVLQFHSVSSCGAEMNIRMCRFEKSATAQSL